MLRLAFFALLDFALATARFAFFLLRAAVLAFFAADFGFVLAAARLVLDLVFDFAGVLALALALALGESQK